MKTTFITLVLFTSLLAANEKQKTNEELIAEFMKLEQQIQKEKIKQEKIDLRIKELNKLEKNSW